MNEIKAILQPHVLHRVLTALHALLDRAMGRVQ